MARGSDQAKAAATSAQNISGTASGNANALYSTLAPELMAESANPSGFSPTDLAMMDTAAMQTAGGGQAAATGAGGLAATRTRNAGAPMAAIAKSARGAGEEASAGVLSNRMKNAMLKQDQRQSARGMLGGMYGTNLGAGVNALGEVANNVNADVNAQNASWNWAKYIMAPLLNSASMAAPAISKAFAKPAAAAAGG